MSPQQHEAEARLVRLATRLWRAMEAARPELPEETQAVLAVRIDEGDVEWVFVLVLAGWQLSNAKEPGAEAITEVLKESGAVRLVQQLRSLERFLPDRFTQFLDVARDAKASSTFVEAGSHFTGAVQEMLGLQRDALHAWLRGVQFREVGRALVRRFPLPSPKSLLIWKTPAVPPAPPSTYYTARGERFDRADRSLLESGRPTASHEASLQNAPLSQAPATDFASIARAYLFTRGWRAAEVERLLRGPGASTVEKKVRP